MQQRGRLHGLLFVLTFITTHIAGATWLGVDVWETPLQIWRGWSFAIPLLVILGVHEFGHYFFARKYGVPVSLPYFIPAPTLIGTFGAVIRMRGMPRDPRKILEIGVAGPIAGLVIAIPVTYIGLLTSDVLILSDLQIVSAVEFGESLLFKAMSWSIFGTLSEDQIIMISPTAFAGWVGLFVTALNLLPMGQLDGGHIFYSVSRKYSLTVSRVVLVGIALMGVEYWPGWILLAVIGIFIGAYRGRPKGLVDPIPLDPIHYFLAILALIILILTIIPQPVSIVA